MDESIRPRGEEPKSYAPPTLWRWTEEHGGYLVLSANGATLLAGEDGVDVIVVDPTVRALIQAAPEMAALLRGVQVSQTGDCGWCHEDPNVHTAETCRYLALLDRLPKEHP